EGYARKLAHLWQGPLGLPRRWIDTQRGEKQQGRCTNSSPPFMRRISNESSHVEHSNDATMSRIWIAVDDGLQRGWRSLASEEDG
ncbi:hypothetical protein F441_11032, partial [Phytophthora nicotianae CJ01A1]